MVWRTRDIVGTMVWLVAVCWMATGLADDRTCPRSALDVAGTSDSWAQLAEHFDLYSHCDDGGLAESYSESVTVLFAEKWQHVEQYEAMARSRPGFCGFVLRHIDATVPAERLERIKENAKDECPRGLENLCHEIERQAISALREYWDVE